jgi:MSHA biogenesis protein MshO
MHAAVKSGRGFTLMEMVLAIIILGIVGTSFGVFIIPAVNAHLALQNRAALIDSAEIALRRMARDIRIALPNSVRVSNSVTDGFAIESIPTVDGGRYCVSGEANCTAGAQELLIASSDTDFDILGCFQSSFNTASGSTAYRLVVGDSTGALYSASGTSAVMTPSSTAITVSVSNGGGGGAGACGASSGANTTYRHHIALSAGQTFPNPSSRRRVFVIQTPVTYVCNKSAGTLTRYSGYSISATQPTPTSPPAGGSSALVTDKVANCSVSTSTATVQTQGFVSLSISLTNSGETVTLFDQAQLDNSL